MKAKVSLQAVTILVTCLLLTFMNTLFARTTPYELGKTPEVTFTTKQVQIASNQSIQVCLTHPRTVTISTAEVELIAPESPSQALSGPPTKVFRVPLLPGKTQTCTKLNLPLNPTTLALGIVGTQERLIIEREGAHDPIVARYGAMPTFTAGKSESTIATDNYGNYFSAQDLKIPTSKDVEQNSSESGNSSNCSCSQVGIDLKLFEPIFEDCTYNTGIGFDDMVEGPARVEAVCAALEYLEKFIVPNESICNPGDESQVNIRVYPTNVPDDYPIISFPPINPNIIGFASPVYRNFPFYVGVRYSVP